MSRILNVDFLGFVLTCGILLITVAISSCSKQRQVALGGETSNSEMKKEALKFAHSALSPEAKVIPNQDSTFFLVSKKGKPRTIFLVTDIKSQIVYNKQSINGNVKWTSNTTLVFQDLPNLLEDRSSKPSDYNQIIDLKELN